MLRSAAGRFWGQSPRTAAAGKGTSKKGGRVTVKLKPVSKAAQGKLAKLKTDATFTLKVKVSVKGAKPVTYSQSVTLGS